MSSPTQRSLKVLRGRGYLADVTEKWIPGANIRRDLFGFIDVLAIKEGEIVGVQACSATDVARRIDKISNHENVGIVRQCGMKLFVHGWRKNSKNRWVLREVDVS
jgi:hypothetical protein